jgi:ribosomal protein S18 acetylase RimI-like enzyme
MANASITIRSMTEDDINAVVDINREIIGKGRALTYDFIQESQRVYDIGGQMGLSQVAVEGEKVVGFILGRILTHYFLVEEAGVITNIGVLPNLRHKKIASRLVKAFEDECHKRKIKSVRVLINSKDKTLNSFYETLKFKQDDIVELSKSLT